MNKRRRLFSDGAGFKGRFSSGAGLPRELRRGSGSSLAFDTGISLARASIDSCVVMGGSLLAEPVHKSLQDALDRGVTMRIMFPLPTSNWLGSLVLEARGDPVGYGRQVVATAQRVEAAFPGTLIRWYDAPGPCWFSLIDRSALYTKPFDMRRVGIPIADLREPQIEHYGRLFEQLWRNSIADFRRDPRKKVVEPAIHVVPMSEEFMAALAASPGALSSLSPEDFEILVADRLAAMGHGVRRVGATTHEDGGIDIVAWPERNAAFPYLLAVQVKHSRKGRRVRPSVVRDLRGALSTSPFDVGLIVTNTTFTPKARLAARKDHYPIRLRDFDDLVRWLRSDFEAGVLEQDLPEEILLGPGLRIALPRFARE